MTPIIIRETTRDDAETLLAIEQAAFAAYRELLDPQPSVFRETPELIVEKMQHGTFFAAWCNEQIVGMIYCQRMPEYVYLGRLCVLPDWHGQGIARQLMQAVEDWALQHGMSSIQLGVRIALPQLIATYSRYGYTVLSEHSHPGYTQPTFVTMQKRVSEQQ